jgi:uncharacterized protein (TIGR02231 family)
VEKSAYNISFKVPDRTTVPADGREHRVLLREETLQGELEYRAAPAANPAAFMVVKTRSPADYPLLAGPVRAFVARAYLGAFPLAEIGPGAELIVPFGVDNRIAVERIPVPGRKGESGLFGKERRIATTSRSSIENRRDVAVRIIVEDRLPVTEDERIRVEMGELTPGWKDVEDRPGVKRWELTLAPGEKREVQLQYVIRFPRDLTIVPVGEERR